MSCHSGFVNCTVTPQQEGLWFESQSDWDFAYLGRLQTLNVMDWWPAQGVLPAACLCMLVIETVKYWELDKYEVGKTMNG